MVICRFLRSVDIGEEDKAKKSAIRDEDIDEREPDEPTNKAGVDEESEDEAVGEDDDATAVRLKAKVQDECDYDEANVDEEKRDASDDEAEADAELHLDEENHEEGDVEEDETIIGLESGEFQQVYKIDKEHHLWCELSFQVVHICWFFYPCPISIAVLYRSS